MLLKNWKRKRKGGEGMGKKGRKGVENKGRGVVIGKLHMSLKRRRCV